MPAMPIAAVTTDDPTTTAVATSSRASVKSSPTSTVRVSLVVASSASEPSQSRAATSATAIRETPSPSPSPSSPPSPSPPRPPEPTTSVLEISLIPDPSTVSSSLDPLPTAQVFTFSFSSLTPSPSSTLPLTSSPPPKPSKPIPSSSSTLAKAPLRSSTTEFQEGFLGIPTSPPQNSPNHAGDPENTSKSGSRIGGIVGGIVGVVLAGLLIFFLWKWRSKLKFQRRNRLSFGPYGNGIDASTGSVLVSSVACKPIHPMDYGRSNYEQPPPGDRYFRPDVAAAKPFPNPIHRIDELPERDSREIPKFGKHVTFGESERALKNGPFDNGGTLKSEALDEKQNMAMLSELVPAGRLLPPPEPARRARGPYHSRSRSSGSVVEPLRGGYANGNHPGAGFIPRTHPYQQGLGGPRSLNHSQSHDSLRQARQNEGYRPANEFEASRGAFANSPSRYPGQGLNRSFSFTREDGMFDAGRRPEQGARPPGPPPIRRPSHSQAGQPAMSPPRYMSPGVARRTSTVSIRERPSPAHWAGPDLANPLLSHRMGIPTGAIHPMHAVPMPEQHGPHFGAGVRNAPADVPARKASDAARNF
ncbi:hypothetical protein EJ06DRAFT_156075 [Trichodelitschia bisporula]|uniref:Uncharacterized protein n=1 Tax=Trichodelitschia bisporula TaxID=703511 RepID=A0A6G1HNK1_9PEZI|nr:hypothetical protein EJ06DRAFT_156075 [Trichodelitschia bisporula]